MLKESPKIGDCLSFLTKFPDRPEKWHDYRYAVTIEKLYPYLSGDIDKYVLEIGGETVFTKMLKAFYPNVVLTQSQGDIRKPWRFDYKSGEPVKAFDLILAMEVFEHLRDMNDSPMDTWQYSGVKGFLSQCRSYLHKYQENPGRLFLTTPNVCSLKALYNVLTGHSPMMFAPHVREYSIPELQQCVEANGFAIEKVWTETVWGQHGLTKDTQQTLQTLLKRDWWLPEFRGDDIFMVCK